MCEHVSIYKTWEKVNNKEGVEEGFLEEVALKLGFKNE
jgi:hypothetical protein